MSLAIIYCRLNYNSFILRHILQIMKKMLLPALISLSILSAEAQNYTTPPSVVNTGVQSFPTWITQSNIYEVNVRQYTKEGTFNAFAQHLPRLKQMGVDILWFMPITPISKIDRKGKLGSYYAVADYEAVNPEFGSLDDWKALVDKAHSQGMKVIIDWVANHTGADNRWLKSNPEFFIYDNKGNAKFAFDWSDTRDLNYDNPVLKDSMTSAMKFWVRETGIDGFRCDVAAEVPRSFWQYALAELKRVKPDIFMLAEADVAWVHDAGFNASYGWDMFAKMKDVAAGKSSAKVLDSVLHKQDESFMPGAIKMYFTSNHDENSWNKSDYGTFPGDKHAPFAVFTQTMRNSLPLIYAGQEEPYLDSLSFFYKDEIKFGKFQRAPLYTKLLSLRKSNAALAVDAGYTKILTNDDDRFFAFTREKNGDRVLVVLNFSGKPGAITLKSFKQAGQGQEIFTGKSELIESSKPVNLPAWGYAVYTF